jgi:hypothetical protein
VRALFSNGSGALSYSISQMAAERKLFSYEKILEKILDSFRVQTDITCREIIVVT